MDQKIRNNNMINYSYLALGDSYTIGEQVLFAENFPNQTVQQLRRSGFGFYGAEIIAKTGWTTYGNNNIGWYIGYVERNDNVWFFATRLHKKELTAEDNFQSCRKIITNKILKEMKIIE